MGERNQKPWAMLARNVDPNNFVVHSWVEFIDEDGKEWHGRVRHLFRGGSGSSLNLDASHHFGLDDRLGENIGVFRYKRNPSGSYIWKYPSPPPFANRKLAILRQFEDPDAWSVEDDTDDTEIEQFFAWMANNHYGFGGLDPETLMMEYLNRRE